MIGLPQSQQPYAYAHNNPATWTDPSGLCIEPISATICLVVGGVAISAEVVARAAVATVGLIATVQGVRMLMEECQNREEAIGPIHGPPERGLPPPGVTPPGYDPETWKVGPASRPAEQRKGGKSIRDPEGGEWRYFPGDERYHEPHWDYHPAGNQNLPWENVPLEPGGKIFK
jgi:hypothetical protein